MTEVAILAKAPIPGFAKTRLIPLLGPEGAAQLQERLIGRALATALAATTPGETATLWCAPDEMHATFQAAARRPGVRLARQPEGDLGARMHFAFLFTPADHVVVIGTDCPVLTPADLKDAATALADADVVIAPAEDGGYGLIACRAVPSVLLLDMPWGTDRVAELTRERARQYGLRLVELRTVWDVDTPADFERLRAADLGSEIWR